MWEQLEEVLRQTKLEKWSAALLEAGALDCGDERVSKMAKAFSISSIFRTLSNVIVPKFWSYFESSENNKLRHEVFLEAIQYLSDSMEDILSGFDKMTLLGQDVRRQVESRLESIISATVTSGFNSFARIFFPAVFHAYQRSTGYVPAEDSSAICTGCERNTAEEMCICEDTLTAFQQGNRLLSDFGLHDALVRDATCTVCFDSIKKYVHDMCGTGFESKYLPTLEAWLKESLMEWVRFIYKFYNGKERFYRTDTLQGYLMHYLYDTYLDLRREQLFDAIVEYPDSIPALEDLRECIETAGGRASVMESLQDAMRRRLFHPGVHTADIISAYVSIIKSLRVLDPTGFMLQVACEPVSEYLKTRDNTVRVIVSSLTDENSVEFSGELGRPVEAEQLESDDEWDKWMPDPMGCDKVKISKGTKSSDIITLLVNIYGSKELFVTEYASLLADRLLNSNTADPEKEVCYLELLKLRFGESNLNNCEVMLKDVSDSKRFNGQTSAGELQSDETKDFPLSAMIISAQFWPQLKEETVKLPECLQKHIDAFTKAYEFLHANRSLVWKHNLGQVDLKIETDDGRTLEIQTSPIHTALLKLFEDKPRWSLQELVTATDLTATQVRRKLAFWQNHNVIREQSTDIFTTVTSSAIDQSENASASPLDIADDDDDDQDGAAQRAAGADQKNSELQQMYWSYTVGMLTNLEALTLERIYTMLRMFAMQGPSTSNEFSSHDLKAFLDQKVAEQKLTFSDGLYRLTKSDS